jgi:hypothetical protein
MADCRLEVRESQLALTERASRARNRCCKRGTVVVDLDGDGSNDLVVQEGGRLSFASAGSRTGCSTSTSAPRSPRA